MDQTSHSRKTPHISPLRVSYGVSFVRILKKIDRVITAPYCIYDLNLVITVAADVLETHPTWHCYDYKAGHDSV